MSGDYLLSVLNIALIYSILAVSLNLVSGFAGLLNLGHAAFFAIGAYTSALLTLVGIPFGIALPFAGILAALFGLLLGATSLKLRGDYLALAALGFGEIVRIVLKNWDGLTRGALGLVHIPRPSFLQFTVKSPFDYFILYFIIALVSFFVMKKICNSPFGRTLKAIRDDEIAATSLGKNVFRYKVTALFIAAFFAGIAGSMFAHVITYIEPNSFTFLESTIIVAMVVLGGVANIKGSVIAAFVLIGFPELFKFVVQVWIPFPASAQAGIKMLVYGLLIIGAMLYQPEGWGIRKLVRKKSEGNA